MSNNPAIDAEVEALLSIFEDLKLKVEKSSVEIECVPKPEHPYDSNVNQVGVVLSVRKFENYPDQAPEVVIKKSKNLFGTRLETLEKIVEEVKETHAGFEMLFDLYQEVQDWLKKNNKAIASVHAAIHADDEEDEESEDEEQEESASSDSPKEESAKLLDRDLVAEDCRVTEADFMKWKVAFKQEMINSKIWMDIDTQDGRPSGKQLFIGGTVDATVKPDISEELAESASPPAAAPAGVFWENKNLYEENDEELDIELDDE